MCVLHLDFTGLCSLFVIEAAKKRDDTEEDQELQGTGSDDDDWDNELGDDDEDNDEAASQKLQKLAAEVCQIHTYCTTYFTGTPEVT